MAVDLRRDPATRTVALRRVGEQLGIDEEMLRNWRNWRDRQRRNLLATLLLSAGVPVLLGGDEMARTHGGNNNAYCQDDEISWTD